MNLPSISSWFVAGWDFRKAAASHIPSIFSGSGKEFVKGLSALSRTSYVESLKTISCVKIPIVKWLPSTHLDKKYQAYHRLVIIFLFLLVIVLEQLQQF